MQIRAKIIQILQELAIQSRERVPLNAGCRTSPWCPWGGCRQRAYSSANSAQSRMCGPTASYSGRCTATEHRYSILFHVRYTRSYSMCSFVYSWGILLWKMYSTAILFKRVVNPIPSYPGRCIATEYRFRTLFCTDSDVWAEGVLI